MDKLELRLVAHNLTLEYVHVTMHIQNYKLKRTMHAKLRTPNFNMKTMKILILICIHIIYLYNRLIYLSLINELNIYL